VHLVGIGTSWHAAIIAKEFFLRFVCDQVLVHHSFEFAERPPAISGSSLIIIITHRGTKK
jgi:glucosamine 6-phosphate synthetase-like amidotransferase/phosphosugar isomerase protein